MGWWKKFWRNYCGFPLPATNLKYKIVRIKRMKTATVKVTWKKSLSIDVIRQRILIQKLTNNGYVSFLNIELPIDVQEYYFKGDEKETFSVNVLTSDGVWETNSETLQIYIPDLSLPAPATNLTWTITNVEEKTPEY